MSSPHLQRKLKEALGHDAGAELAAVTDRIDPIRGDIAELRHAMEQGFARAEQRFKQMDERLFAHAAKVDGAMHAHAANVDGAIQAHAAKVDGAIHAYTAKVDGANHALAAKVDGAIHKAVAEQTRFFFVAWAVILGAIVGLYGTVVSLIR